MKNIILILFISVSSAQPKYFDPNGNYFPVKNAVFAGARLELIHIHTLDYDNNGKLDYDNPKFIEPEIIVFLDTSNRYLAKNINISRDTISFEVDLPKGMILELNGNFIDKRGQFWNRNDIRSQETPIIISIIKVYQKGVLVETKEITFSYWEGD